MGHRNKDIPITASPSIYYCGCDDDDDDEEGDNYVNDQQYRSVNAEIESQIEICGECNKVRRPKENTEFVYERNRSYKTISGSKGLVASGAGHSEEGSPTCWIWILIAGLAILVFVYFNRGSSNTVIPPKIERPTIEEFNNIFRDIKAKETSNNKEVWTYLMSAARAVVKREIAQTPAVIALVALNGSFDEAGAIARKFSTAIEELYNDVETLEIHCNVDPGSKKIHDSIHKKIGRGLSHTVIMYDFDKVSSETAMGMHGFFDDDNAPYKNAFYVLVIGSQLKDVEERDFEVTQPWADKVNRDKLGSLESRIKTRAFVRKP